MSTKSIKVLLSSVIFFLTSLTLVGITTYAWFIITNTNTTQLISKVSDVEAEYEFYYFKDSWHDGNLDPWLMDQLCSVTKKDQCYENIPNPTIVFNYNQAVSPGERFSFAIQITSLGNKAFLSLDLGRVSSINSSDGEMRIQEAFQYEIKKVSYVIDGIEGQDQKDDHPIQYFQQYFTGNDQTIYPLIYHIPMNIEGGQNIMIIVYFDIYYDPSIKGADDLGIPYVNQNHLADQSIIIEDIYMMINPTLN